MLNNNLKDCRDELDMTQEDLGKIFGVSRKTVSGWETNTDPIPFNKLIKFCNLYDYSMDYVLGRIRRNIKYNKIINSDKKNIGNILKKIRNNYKMSQEEFAKKCGVSQTTYSHYETGLNLISTTTAFAICKTYNISLDYSVGRIDNPNVNNI